EGRRDVRRYVTMLEEVLIRTVAKLGIEAGRRDGQRGVWVGNEKIAAIGVRIARWVTSHGFALNVATNLAHFGLITPCGIRGASVTSIEKLTGRAPSLDEVSAIVVQKFAEVFDREMDKGSEALPIVKVIAHDGDRVLLLHRTKAAGAFWQPITGSIERGESEAAAARRELREETGHDAEVVPMNLRQSFVIDGSFLNRENAHPVFADEVIYTARLDSSAHIVLDEEEHDRFGWFSFEEAYSLLRWSDDREALERLEEAIGNRQ
ncbi:MAG TPA: lipoyl(octanoyl) transferase LipB, partial [Thermoanaerobaculia bacterium]